MVAEKKEAAAGMESMAMGSGGGRSKPPLHNFTLPCGLKWGNQKFLRCAKLESDGEIGSSSGEKRDRAKFSLALSRREIEEDFAAIIHHRPPRRPKKRAKYVQKNLDTLFPGLWLTEITPDLYKVPEDQ
nr:uncharacterized protein LOC109161160 isoform X1 [Ipomoea batatas]